jgi:hypothetical protein
VGLQLGVIERGKLGDLRQRPIEHRFELTELNPT